MSMTTEQYWSGETVGKPVEAADLQAGEARVFADAPVSELSREVQDTIANFDIIYNRTNDLVSTTNETIPEISIHQSPESEAIVPVNTAQVSETPNAELISTATTPKARRSLFSGARRYLGEKVSKVNEQRRKARNLALGVLATAGAITGVGVGIANAGQSSHNSKISTKTAAFNSIKLTNQAPKSFETGAFLPPGAINPNSTTSPSDQAADRVQSWFSVSGPLNGPQTLRGSLAAEETFIDEPSKPGTVNVDFNYVDQYKKNFNRLGNSSTAEGVAKSLITVMAKTQKYVKSAEGSQFTELQANYNKQGHFTNSLTVTHVAANKMPQNLIEFEVPDGDNKLNSINPVYVDGKGNQYITGYLPIPKSGKKVSKTGESSTTQTTVPSGGSGGASGVNNVSNAGQSSGSFVGSTNAPNRVGGGGSSSSSTGQVEGPTTGTSLTGNGPGGPSTGETTTTVPTPPVIVVTPPPTTTTTVPSPPPPPPTTTTTVPSTNKTGVPINVSSGWQPNASNSN
jgi:hypothetical protein